MMNLKTGNLIQVLGVSFGFLHHFIDIISRGQQADYSGVLHCCGNINYGLMFYIMTGLISNSQKTDMKFENCQSARNKPTSQTPKMKEKREDTKSKLLQFIKCERSKYP